MRVLKKEGCDTWTVRISIKGPRFEISPGYRNKEVTEKIGREFEREKVLEIAGILPPKALRDAAQAPLAELLETRLNTGLPPTVGPKHRKYSKNRPTRVFQGCGWRFVRDITPESFEAWRSSEYRSGHRSAKTLNDYVSYVRSFLKWLESRQRIAINPLRIVEALPVPKSASHRSFTVAELEALIAVVPSYRACLYTVGVLTGLRRKELQTLEWSEITLDGSAPCIELTPAKTKNGEGGMLRIHPQVVAALQTIREITPNTKRNVFYKGITQMPRFRQDLDLAGIAALDSKGRGLRFHSFRNTFATILRDACVEVSVRKELMRHKDIRLTMELYPDKEQLHMAAALEKLPSFGSSPLSSPKSGKSCPNVSTADQSKKLERKNPQSESLENEQSRPLLTPLVPACPKGEMADWEGSEPSPVSSQSVDNKNGYETVDSPTESRRKYNSLSLAAIFRNITIRRTSLRPHRSQGMTQTGLQSAEHGNFGLDLFDHQP